MTWSYSPILLASSQMNQVRYLIGDTMPGDQQVQDEEINYSLSKYATIYGAAAEVCRTIGTRFARQVDVVQGEMKTNYSSRSKQYFALARDLEMRGTRGLLPYAGGISNSDKDTNAENPDRAPPAFNRGQFDDTLPIGPVGEQTPPASLPDTEPNFP